jgi:RNA polymerase sigma-70 factor (ECF subfamily)
LAIAAAPKTPPRKRSQRSGAPRRRTGPTAVPPRPGCFAVARNAIVNQTRKRVEPATEVPDSPSDGPSPPEQAESDWTSWRVHCALEQLSERHRTLIELAYWSGLSQAEIATQLNIPLGTVKTRTRAALTHLAEQLDREELE